MTVNGHTRPRATLEARRHRLRLLNGCNSRFLLLKLIRTDPLTLASDQPTPGDVALHLIGGDGGLAPGTEEWQIHNFTMDAHPIHVHLVTFEVIERQRLEVGPDGMPHPRTVPGTSRPPDAWEAGRKDMVVAYPGEVTRLKATYDYPGRSTWHCHIVEHEDNEMMRPFDVTVVPSVDLGEAAEYALLALGGANLAVTSASVQGNVGAGPRTVQQLRDIAVSRSLFTDPTARVDRSKGVARAGA